MIYYKKFGESGYTLCCCGGVAAFRTRFRTRFGIVGTVCDGKSQKKKIVKTFVKKFVKKFYLLMSICKNNTEK